VPSLVRRSSSCLHLAGNIIRPMTDREKILRRIKALLDKTVASGCPVDEALAALNKAKVMIDEYGVTDAELQSIGATFYGQRTGNSQSQSQSSPPPPPPPPPRSATPSGFKRMIFIVVALFLLTGIIRTFNYKPPPPAPPPLRQSTIKMIEENGKAKDAANTESKKEVLSAPTPTDSIDITCPAGSDLVETAGTLPHCRYRSNPPTPVPEPPPPVREKFVPPEDEYVTDSNSCSVRGYNGVFVASRLHCQRCPAEYTWDAQNHACRLGTSFRGEAPPDDCLPGSDLVSSAGTGPHCRNRSDPSPSPVRKKFAPADEYVSDNGTCRPGYHEVPWIDRLHCWRCPADYDWDAQNPQCRLGTSFRAEAPPQENRDCDHDHWCPPFVPKEMSERRIRESLPLMMRGLSKLNGEQEYLRIMYNVYTENVIYYGKITPRQDVLEDKRKFMAKWPDRSYSIRPGSLTVTCAPVGDSCNATGIVDFTVLSYSNRISGSAEFNFGMEMHGEGAFINSETDTVFKRQYEIVSADGRSCPGGYDPILHHKAGELYCRSPCAPGYNWNPYYHTCK
jgi:hypothetical protein